MCNARAIVNAVYVGRKCGFCVKCVCNARAMCMDPVYGGRTCEFRMKCAWISARQLGMCVHLGMTVPSSPECLALSSFVPTVKEQDQAGPLKVPLEIVSGFPNLTACLSCRPNTVCSSSDSCPRSDRAPPYFDNEGAARVGVTASRGLGSETERRA